jgi:hypothetical protein
MFTLREATFCSSTRQLAVTLSRKEAEEREEKERQLRAERIQREAEQALQRNAAASLAAKQQVRAIFCSKIRGLCTETVCTTFATDENTWNNIPVHTVKKVTRFPRPQPGCQLQNLFPARESLVSDIPGRENLKKKFTVYGRCRPEKHIKRQATQHECLPRLLGDGDR